MPHHATSYQQPRGRMHKHTHTHTHTNICTETIIRNQACAWFKNSIGFQLLFMAKRPKTIFSEVAYELGCTSYHMFTDFITIKLLSKLLVSYLMLHYSSLHGPMNTFHKVLITDSMQFQCMHPMFIKDCDSDW